MQSKYYMTVDGMESDTSFSLCVAFFLRSYGIMLIIKCIVVSQVFTSEHDIYFGFWQQIKFNDADSNCFIPPIHYHEHIKLMHFETATTIFPANECACASTLLLFTMYVRIHYYCYYTTNNYFVRLFHSSKAEILKAGKKTVTGTFKCSLQK